MRLKPRFFRSTLRFTARYLRYYRCPANPSRYSSKPDYYRPALRAHPNSPIIIRSADKNDLALEEDWLIVDTKEVKEIGVLGRRKEKDRWW